MKKALTLLPLMLALAGVCTVTRAQEAKGGDAGRGAQKAAMCIGCHGITGYQASFPEVYKVPKISGQGAKYLSAALDAYRKGDRKHPSMRAIAASLTDQDIADLSAYYEQHGKTGAAELPEAKLPDALKDKLTACIACHGPTFSKPLDPTYPRLAGQHADYLYAALKGYATDGNPHIGRANAVMRGQLVVEADGKKKLNFTNDELRQVSKWLASLPGELKTVEQSRLR
ncbi:cytochrome c4 [Aquincola sp. S2]|uniref:Cytochrome c4 n=1 Tax=Pseudaquabacterium terrae TaxID=2732868 RepID=A0ABX2EHK4_9BURK|nr:c-type cytochrome [Aquabacterium terrae]NRF68080.1 cytochrome c4 [Aquabacterium terrae]